MKVKNLNNSSKKTKKLIKDTFAVMLSEKKELSKIQVSELVRRADINRGTFYSHYDDIYSVAEDYENELINNFFDNVKLLKSTDVITFTDSFFAYIKQNDENYKMLCKSNDFLFSAKKLTSLAAGKLLEICNNDARIKNKKFLDIEINIFIEGLVCEYIKYCRSYSTTSLDELYEYTKSWIDDFSRHRGLK